MKLAFIVLRKNLFRYYSSIIIEAIKRGYSVECWLGQIALPDDIKFYLNVNEDGIPDSIRKHLKTYIFTETDEIIDIAKRSKPDVIIANLDKKFFLKDSEYKGLFVTIQIGIDTFSVSARIGGDCSSDLLCLYSPYWKSIAAEIYEFSGYGPKKDYIKKIENKIAFTGSPQFDQFSKIDPVEVRKRWNIPKHDPVVLLLPIPISNLSDSWSVFFATENRIKRLKTLLFGGIYESPKFVFDHYRWIIKNWDDSHLNHALDQFAKNNKSFLLVKGREKDPIRPSLESAAKKVVYDVSYYPATIFEALSVADLCIHFYSTATLEAAYAGIPSLCIHRPSPFAKYNSTPPYPTRWWSDKVMGPFNFKNVNSWMTIPDAIKLLPEISLDAFSVEENARKEYVEKYLGYSDGDSSARVLDAIEERI